MILYEEGKWRPLFSLKGSVLHKAARWSIPFSFLCLFWTLYLDNIDPEWSAWLQGMDMSDRLRDFSFILGFLIVFRSQKAYSRWWEGGTLLQQLRGEWFNAFSSLLAFCNVDPKLEKEVHHFQKYLACMISLLYANALRQVSAMEDTSFELIGIEGFDIDSLEYMVGSHDSCEVVLQWVQRLIVEANGKDIIKIAPPILSRVYNQLGNGIVKLNNARKIRQFPIPFPLAQMVAFMLVVHTVVTSAVVAFSVGSPVVGPCLACAVISAFWCIFYISVELEQPYGDDPNDLPLHDMMRDLNQSLLGILHPIAKSPPEYASKLTLKDKLTREKLDLAGFISMQRASGTARRRTRLAPQMPWLKQAKVVKPPPAAASSGVPNYESATEGSATMGGAEEGSAGDKTYVEGKVTLREVSAPSSPPPCTPQQVAPAQAQAQAQVSSEEQVEPKAVQAFRPSQRNAAGLGDCLPCQTLNAQRR